MLAVGEALSDSNSKAIDSSRFPVLYSDENDHALFPNGLIDSIAATLRGPSQYAEPAYDAMASVTRIALHSEATMEAVTKGDGRVSRTGIFKPIPRPTMRDALVHLQSVRAAKLNQTEERSAETLSLGLIGEETKLMMDCMQPTQEVLQQELAQLNRAASERPSLEEMRIARLERGCDRTYDVLKYRDAARSGTARRGGGSSIRKVSTRLVGSPLAVASMRAWSLQGSGLRGRPGGPSPAETSTTRPHAAVASQYQRSSAQPSYRTSKPARALKREVLRIRYSSKTSQTAGCAGHFLGSVSLRSIDGCPSPFPDASYKQGAPSSTFLTEAHVVRTRDSPGSGARSPAKGMDSFVDEAVAFGDDASLNAATRRSSQDLLMQPPVPGGTEQPARPHRSRTSRPRIDASSIAAACGATVVSSGAGHGSIAASIRSSRPPVASRQTVPIQYQSVKLPVRLTCAGYLSIGGAPTRPHISKAQARAASIRKRLALTRKVFALMQEGKPMGEACSIVVKHAKMARQARKRRLQSMPDGGAAGSEQGTYQLQDTMASDGSSAGWGTVMAAYGAGLDAGSRPARQGKEAAALSGSSLSLLRDEAIESCAGLSVLDTAVFEQDYRSLKQLLADCEREEKAETRRRNGQSPANEDDTVAKPEAAGLNKRVLSCLRSSHEVHKQTRQATRSIRADSRKHQKRIAGAKRKVMSNPQRLVEVAALRNAEARQEQERKEEAIKVMVRRMRMEAL